MPLLALGLVPRVRLVPLGDREFRAEPGDVYYAKRGHVFAAETGTELVESTPANEQARVMAALSQVLSDEAGGPRRPLGLPYASQG